MYSGGNSDHNYCRASHNSILVQVDRYLICAALCKVSHIYSIMFMSADSGGQRTIFLEPLGRISRRVWCRVVLLKLPKQIWMCTEHQWVCVERMFVYLSSEMSCSLLRGPLSCQRHTPYHDRGTASSNRLLIKCRIYGLLEFSPYLYSPTSSIQLKMRFDRPGNAFQVEVLVAQAWHILLHLKSSNVLE